MIDRVLDSSGDGLGRGRSMLVAAALLWSTSGAFAKSPPLAAIPEDVRGPLLACFRALSAAGVLALFVRPRHARWRPMLVPLVISFAAMNVLFVTALTLTTAAAAIFLQYTSTFWAFVFSVAFLREKTTRANVFALACACAGMVWIIAGDWASQIFFGNVLALGSGICYAGVIVSLKGLQEENAAWLVTLCHGAAGMVLLPAVVIAHFSLSPIQWMLVVLFGIVQMGVPYVLFARALAYVSTQEAALLTLIEPIANPLWVWLLWGETVGAATWIGGGFIIGGLAGRFLMFGRGADK